MATPSCEYKGQSYTPPPASPRRTSEMSAEAPPSEPAPVTVDATRAGHAPAVAERAPGAVRKRVFGAVGVMLAVGGVVWFATHYGRESTDDAQVDGEVVAVPSRATGVVAKVHFVENQAVKAGELLAELDDAQAKARLAQAEAALAAAEASADAADADASVAETNAHGSKAYADASLDAASAGATSASDQIRQAEAEVAAASAAHELAKAEGERAKKLFDDGAVAKAVLDQAEAGLAVAASRLDGAKAHLAQLRDSASAARAHIAEASARQKQTSNVSVLIAQAEAKAKAARAQVATARALRDLAKLDLDYTRVFAPRDGVVSKKTIAVGQGVAAGQAVVQLVTQPVWVTANLKETQIENVREGQRAKIEVDAFPHADVFGVVESLSGATGSRFALLPPDNASGNFTKIVQRVPVRVKVAELPKGVVLRPGMNVELTIDTRGR